MRVTGLVIGDGWGWGVKTESKNCMNNHSVLSRQRQRHGSYGWCLVVKCSYKLSLCPHAARLLLGGDHALGDDDHDDYGDDDHDDHDDRDDHDHHHHDNNGTLLCWRFSQMHRIQFP